MYYGLRHYATSRKVAGSSPDEVDFFKLTQSFQPHYDLGVDSASNRNVRNARISIIKWYFVAVLLLRFDSKQASCIHIIIMLAWRAFDINTSTYVVKNCLPIKHGMSKQNWIRIKTVSILCSICGRDNSGYEE
jgi:hypothetical protein